MNKHIILIMTMIILLLSSITFAVTFSDLTNNHWSYEAVNSMAEVNILNGYPDGSFKPNNPVSLAEFSKILIEFYQIDDKPYTSISSSLENHWAYEYLKKISNYWTNSESFSDVDAPVLREDVISTIIKVRGYESNRGKNHDWIHFYKDRDEIRSDLWDYIEIALEDKIVQGDQYILNPKGNLTRAEVCQIIYNICKIDNIDLKNRIKNNNTNPTSSNQSFANLAQRHNGFTAANKNDVGIVYIGSYPDGTYPVYYRMVDIYSYDRIKGVIDDFNSNTALTKYEIEEGCNVYGILFDIDLKDFKVAGEDSSYISGFQFMRDYPTVTLMSDTNSYYGKGRLIPADATQTFYKTGDITQMYCVIQVPEEIDFSYVIIHFLCDNDLSYEQFLIELDNTTNNEEVNNNSNDDLLIKNSMAIENQYAGTYKNKANETLKYTDYVTFHDGKDDNYFSVFTGDKSDVNEYIPDFWGKTTNRYIINFTESTQKANDIDVPECQFVLVCDDTTGFDTYVIDMYTLSNDKTFLESQIRGEQYNFYKVKDSYDISEFINETFDFENQFNGIYKEDEKQIEIIALKNQNLGASDSMMLLSNNIVFYYWKENLSDNSLPYVLELYLKDKNTAAIKDIYTNRYYANYCSGIIIYQDNSMESFVIQMGKGEIPKVQVDLETKLIKKKSIEKPSDNLTFLDKWNYQTLLRNNSFSKIVSK